MCRISHFPLASISNVLYSNCWVIPGNVATAELFVYSNLYSNLKRMSSVFGLCRTLSLTRFIKILSIFMSLNIFLKYIL